MTTKREEQIQLEKKYSKYELIPFLVQRAKELTTQFSELNQEVSSLIIAYMFMQKRMKPEELMGRVYSKYKDVNLITEQLELCIKLELIIYDNNRDELITAYRLDDTDEKQRLLFMYPLPMIVKPEPVINNYDTGYITTKYSIICRNKAGSDDYNLDHINKVNSIALTINKSVLKHCHNRNKNPPTTMQEEKNFEKFSDMQRNIAEVYSVEDKFYLTHRYDKRGRIYPTGYWINYQGNDFAKALIEFAEPEKLSKT